jgi:hypothetical protein
MEAKENFYLTYIVSVGSISGTYKENWYLADQSLSQNCPTFSG